MNKQQRKHLKPLDDIMAVALEERTVEVEAGGYTFTLKGRPDAGVTMPIMQLADPKKQALAKVWARSIKVESFAVEMVVWCLLLAKASGHDALKWAHLCAKEGGAFIIAVGKVAELYGLGSAEDVKTLGEDYDPNNDPLLKGLLPNSPGSDRPSDTPQPSSERPESLPQS